MCRYFGERLVKVEVKRFTMPRKKGKLYKLV